MLVKIFADASFQHAHLNRIIRLGDSDPIAEHSDRLRCIATAPQTGDRGHTRIVPAGYVFLFNQLGQLALAHYRVLQVETGKFNLPGMTCDADVIQHPIIEWPVVLKLEGAERVGNAFECIRDRVSKIVHRIDTPRFPCLVMNDAVPNSVDGRVTHIEIG